MRQTADNNSRSWLSLPEVDAEGLAGVSGLFAVLGRGCSMEYEVSGALLLLLISTSLSLSDAKGS